MYSKISKFSKISRFGIEFCLNFNNWSNCIGYNLLDQFSMQDTSMQSVNNGLQNKESGPYGSTEMSTTGFHIPPLLPQYFPPRMFCNQITPISPTSCIL